MSKNKVEVVIDGVIYSLQGEESQEHMQRVARFVNDQTTNVQNRYSKQHMNPSKLNMLVTLNIADEYVKMQYELERCKEELDKYDKEKTELEERVRDLTLDVMETKQELANMEKQIKKDHINRGR